MKLSAQEEYGLRCLLHIARRGEDASLTIPEISKAEGLSQPYVAKLMRVLRRGGFVKSVRGQAGGYTLARPAEEIPISEALAVLGGRIYEADFCDRYSGVGKICNHTVDCGVRSLWRAIQEAVDQVASKTTLRDLVADEREVAARVKPINLSANKSRESDESPGKPQVA
jgi:Rrf2 family protein